MTAPVCDGQLSAALPLPAAALCIPAGITGNMHSVPSLRSSIPNIANAPPGLPRPTCLQAEELVGACARAGQLLQSANAKLDGASKV